VRKDGRDQRKVASVKDDDPGNPTINFHGEKRRNDTHHSTTDGESVLYRKAKGKEAKLSFGAHLLMENRNGLCAEFSQHNPITESEPAMALRQLDAHVRLHEGVAPQDHRRRQELPPETVHSRLPPAGNHSACGLQGWPQS